MNNLLYRIHSCRLTQNLYQMNSQKVVLQVFLGYRFILYSRIQMLSSTNMLKFVMVM